MKRVWFIFATFDAIPTQDLVEDTRVMPPLFNVQMFLHVVRITGTLRLLQ